MHGGCSGCSGHTGGHCGNQCFSVGPFRAISKVCPPVRTGAGSRIAFSSGIVPAILVSAASGLIGTVSAVGFGTSITGLTLVNNAITLPVVGTGVTEAFTVSQAGSITTIAATFTETVGITVPIVGSATIRAEIYRAPAGSNSFTPTGAAVNLTPSITGLVSVGAIFQGSATTDVPVAVGDRLVMVFSTSGGLATTLTGAASAGITIS